MGKTDKETVARKSHKGERQSAACCPILTPPLVRVTLDRFLHLQMHSHFTAFVQGLYEKIHTRFLAHSNCSISINPLLKGYARVQT